jgi:hypothetical protein
MSDIGKLFQDKYTEFCEKLQGALPELSSQISAAAAFSAEERSAKFATDVLPKCPPTRDSAKNPETVLPGVTISDQLWSTLGEGSQKAIQEYLSIMSMCCLYDGNDAGIDLSGVFTKEFTENIFNGIKEKIGGLNLEELTKKMTSLFGGLGPDKMPKLPERFLKGHLARLAEELVKEFKPEDFGLGTDELKACDTDPARAFTLLTEIYTKKPEVLQKAIQRIASRLQEKIRRGEIRPEQIKVEAEELIKEFSGNGSFVELMESFRSTFGMEDPDLAREVGRDGDARRNLVKERLRKKMEAKKAGKK